MVLRCMYHLRYPTGEGAGAGVSSLVDATSPGRCKLPHDFERPSALLSVLGVLSVMLGCDVTNTCCCAAVLCAISVCVFLVSLYRPGGRKGQRFVSI